MATPFGYLSHIFCSSSLLRHSCWGRLEMFIYFWSIERKEGQPQSLFIVVLYWLDARRKEEELCIKEITNRNKTTTEHMITTDKKSHAIKFSFTRFVSMGARYAEKLSNKRQPRQSLLDYFFLLLYMLYTNNSFILLLFINLYILFSSYTRLHVFSDYIITLLHNSCIFLCCFCFVLINSRNTDSDVS